ncbi:hypothetical protein GCM10027079_03740 [Sediminivirga luteola]|uniref:Uncharacterized protein n=1 Tax=Sediminivirga luteola TaxID=1774748 RepID=A0A8J2TWR7_9MICO|nr:hypothetical protein GCM10011333_10920 [Sediminivirga luteola]
MTRLKGASHPGVNPAAGQASGSGGGHRGQARSSYVPGGALIPRELPGNQCAAPEIRCPRDVRATPEGSHGIARRRIRLDL